MDYFFQLTQIKPTYIKEKIQKCDEDKNISKKKVESLQNIYTENSEETLRITHVIFSFSKIHNIIYIFLQIQNKISFSL